MQLFKFRSEPVTLIIGDCIEPCITLRFRTEVDNVANSRNGTISYVRFSNVPRYGLDLQFHLHSVEAPIIEIVIELVYIDVSQMREIAFIVR